MIVAVPGGDARLATFFDYLHAHLAENGSPATGYFQPVARAGAQFTEARAAAYRGELERPVGEAGWRRLWIAVAASHAEGVSGVSDTAGSARGAIAGHVDLRGYPDAASRHRCQIGLGVASAYRRKGCATTLLVHAIAWAEAEPSLAWLDLHVLGGNAGAVALYRRHGFTESGRVFDRFRVDGESLDDVAMTRSVGAATAP